MEKNFFCIEKALTRKILKSSFGMLKNLKGMNRWTSRNSPLSCKAGLFLLG
jgi:hypothetical protein